MRLSKWHQKVSHPSYLNSACGSFQPLLVVFFDVYEFISLKLLLPNFWHTYLIKFSKNPKIAKNNGNPKKKNIFYIFASFLAFSTLSKKRIKIFKNLSNTFNFSLVVFKILDFPHWFNVDIACFQKYKKKKQEKSKFTKKESWGIIAQHDHINYLNYITPNS